MAGAAAAMTDNGVGVAGICPGGRIMPVKVATAGGHTDDADGNPRVAAGIRWAVDHGASVISFSLGAGDNPAMRDAVNYAYAHNVLIVAAAGNSGSGSSPYPGPAYFPHVLAAGGTDNRDRRMSYSGYGMQHLVMAPSVDVPTTARGGGVGKGSYTSIAAPQVAGVAALLLSVRPGLTVDELIALIEKGADPVDGQQGFDPRVGYGRVNAYRSLQLALAMPGATPNAVPSGIHLGGSGTTASFTVTFSSRVAGEGTAYYGGQCNYVTIPGSVS
jgi:subtilisin family serine protease